MKSLYFALFSCKALCVRLLPSVRAHFYDLIHRGANQNTHKHTRRLVLRCRLSDRTRRATRGRGVQKTRRVDRFTLQWQSSVAWLTRGRPQTVSRDKGPSIDYCQIGGGADWRGTEHGSGLIMWRVEGPWLPTSGQEPSHRLLRWHLEAVCDEQYCKGATPGRPASRRCLDTLRECA